VQRQRDMNDPHDLRRFLDAQNPVFDRVRAELRCGRKASHWMWFVFPQLRGLGSSALAQRYAIASRAEAAAYLVHRVLGARLRECTRLVNATAGRTVGEIFGHPDDLKFHSSMTLFAQAGPELDIFSAAIDTYYGGEPDPETLRLLKG